VSPPDSRAGREHYAEAVQLAEAVSQPHPQLPKTHRVLRADADPRVIALAQVYATLALVDAVVLVPGALP
jgi:hypothetical protein